MKRKSIGNAKRFEVFKRDSFTCVYCGNKPPNIVLEIDHVQAFSKGGSDKIENLVTSCFECNRGKRDKDLLEIPKTIEVDNERLLQYKDYLNFIKSKNKLEEIAFNIVLDIYKIHYEIDKLDAPLMKAIRMFIDKIGIENTSKAINSMCNKKFRYRDDMLRYFCGICWNIFKDKPY